MIAASSAICYFTPHAATIGRIFFTTPSIHSFSTLHSTFTDMADPIHLSALQSKKDVEERKCALSISQPLHPEGESANASPGAL